MQKQLAIKLILIAVLGLLILIPVGMVQGKLYERQEFLAGAKTQVAASWSGGQQVLTPVLLVRYRVADVPKNGFYKDSVLPLREKSAILAPLQLAMQIDVSNSAVSKGIYSVPVYDASLHWQAKFDAAAIRALRERLRQSAHFDSFASASLSFYISDVRGIASVPELHVGDKTVDWLPGSRIDALGSGLHYPIDIQQFDTDSWQVEGRLALRGMETLELLPAADSSELKLVSDWPHPQFIGSVAPNQRDISANGFTAHWQLSRYSMNTDTILSECITGRNCDAVLKAMTGVAFIEAVDLYLQSERTIKYAILFVGLSFISFFIFEHVAKRRIHPIQYAFVGLAIAVFYLLLVSLAEHIAFALAYLLATLSCSVLLLAYVRHVLGSWRAGFVYFAMLLALYGLLYVIVQAEDFALLMGSILVFAVLSVLMLVTRKIDWYALGGEVDTAAAIDAQGISAAP